MERNCAYKKMEFQRNYWFALQGDHLAQKDIAFCFSEGSPNASVVDSYRWPCHRVAHPNETMMCAWYLVAASSGHPKSEQAARDYWDECDKKPLYMRQAILGTASELFLRIYHRPLPVAR
jgi:hypothetical protein